MLHYNIIFGLEQQKVSMQFLQTIIAIDAIMGSTKTKAKDFLDNSSSFQERVAKKCMRLKIFNSEKYIFKVIKLIENLYSIENSDSIFSDVEKHLTDFGYYDGY